MSQRKKATAAASVQMAVDGGGARRGGIGTGRIHQNLPLTPSVRLIMTHSHCTLQTITSDLEPPPCPPGADFQVCARCVLLYTLSLRVRGSAATLRAVRMVTSGSQHDCCQLHKRLFPLCNCVYIVLSGKEVNLTERLGRIRRPQRWSG